MRHVLENLFAATIFGDASPIHNTKIIGHLVYDAHVVGDQQYGHTRLLLQITHQSQDLRLNCDIQCRSWLIGYQEFGFTG